MLPLVLARREGAAILEPVQAALHDQRDTQHAWFAQQTHAWDLNLRALRIDIYDLGMAVLNATIEVRTPAGVSLESAARTLKRLTWLKPDPDVGIEPPVATALRAVAQQTTHQFATAIHAGAPHAAQPAWLSPFVEALQTDNHTRPATPDEWGRLLWLHPVHLLHSSDNDALDDCAAQVAPPFHRFINIAGHLTAAAATSGPTYNYGYDANGNRTADAAGTHTFNSANQLTASAVDPGIVYDVNGNLTASAAFNPIAYNAINQTTAVTPPVGGLNLAYAGTGQAERITAGATTSINGLLGVQADTTAGATTYYERDPQGALIAERTGTTEYYYAFDGQGTVTALIDPTGVQRAAYSYDPYGSNATATALNGALPANPWRYTGGYLDPTGLYHLAARYYDPTLGRFTQQDTLTALGNPATVNRYTYTGGNPVNFTDPSGRDIIGGLAGYVAGGLITIGGWWLGLRSGCRYWGRNRCRSRESTNRRDNNRLPGGGRRDINRQFGDRHLQGGLGLPSMTAHDGQPNGQPNSSMEPSGLPAPPSWLPLAVAVVAVVCGGVIALATAAPLIGFMGGVVVLLVSVVAVRYLLRGRYRFVNPMPWDR